MSIPKQYENSLVQVREQSLVLPPEKALDAIISHPRAGELVKSFSAQDLFFLVNEVGLEDSVPLLSLASTRQWQFFVDSDAWTDDILDMESMTKWMELLFSADPDRLVKWLAAHETDLLELWMYTNVSVKYLGPDDDPHDLEPGYFTLDGAFYIKVNEAAEKDDGEEKQEEQLHNKSSFTNEFLRRMAGMDLDFYQKMLVEMTGTIPSETMENAFRIRNVRLGERGFPPPYEAAAIYQNLSPRDLAARPPKVHAEQAPLGYAKPFFPGHFTNPESEFSRSLAVQDNAALRLQLETEFASLCNHVITADRRKMETRDDIAGAVKKCSAFLDMGLKAIERETGQAPEASVRKHTLAEIFQAGFSLTLDLKFKAARWRKDSWFEKKSLPLTFWGEERLGVLGGLLLDKPLFFDNYKTGELYREFESFEDIEESKLTLNKIKSLDGLFASMKCMESVPPRKGLTCENLLLTLWAGAYLGMSPELAPLEKKQFARFFQALFAGGSTVPDSMKENFLEWIMEQTGLSMTEITDSCGPALDDLFTTLEQELGGVSTQALSPRFINMFLIDK